MKRTRRLRHITPLLTITLFLFAALITAGCPVDDESALTSTQRKAAPPKHFPKERPDFAQGKVIYEKHCVNCHGQRGQGDGPVAKSFDPRPTDLTTPNFIARHAPSDLYASITDGLRKMPGFKSTLSDEERWNVFYYTRFFPVSADALSAGKSLYKKHCVTCHGETGKGDGAAGASMDPKPADFTDLQKFNTASDNAFIRSILNGKGNMPKFEGTLSREQAAEVFEYERTFSYTGAPGR